MFYARLAWVHSVYVLSVLLGDPNYAARLRREFLPNTDEHTAHARARLLFGYRFFGIPEAEQTFGPVNDEARRKLSIIPFSEKTLRACASTHMLVADAGPSLEFMRNARPELFTPYDIAPFPSQKNIAAPQWRLIRVRGHMKTRKKTWTEQCAHIRAGGTQVPNMRELVYAAAISLHTQPTHQFFEPAQNLRTADVKMIPTESSTPQAEPQLLSGYFALMSSTKTRDFHLSYTMERADLRLPYLAMTDTRPSDLSPSAS